MTPDARTRRIIGRPHILDSRRGNNLFCATQDVAIDSLAVSTLREDERATANGMMFGGQYLGIALGGGGAIWVSSILGFNGGLIFVSGMLLALLLFVVFFIRDPEATALFSDQTREKGAQIVRAIETFLKDLVNGSGSGRRVALVFTILPVGAQGLAYAILGTLVDIAIVAERFDYAAVLYLDAIFVVFGLSLVPLLRNREPTRLAQPVAATSS